MSDRIEETKGKGGSQIEEPQEDEGLSDDDVFVGDIGIDDILDRLENSDPRLSKVIILTQTIDDTYDGFARLGMAIGRNTHVQALMLDADNQNIRAILFRGIACNQSIKRIHFRHFAEYGVGNACRILTPPFKNNQVERIRIGHCHLKPSCIRSLATSFAGFDSLKEFALTSTIIQDDPGSQQVARDLVQSLSGHSLLRKLDLGYTNLGKHGCSALADLLRNPNTNLRVLDLTSNHLDDTEAAVLSTGMADNTTLKEINLSNNSNITQAGWEALFDHLNYSASCRLEMIKLEGNVINDAAAQCLSTALDVNTTIKTLDLGFVRGITITGWRVLFGSLRSPTCVLEDLVLSDNRLGDGAMVFLTEALATNGSLKSLDLSCNNHVTGAAWHGFFSAVLANPNSGLENLDFGYCDINDDAIRTLTDALVINSKLKVLILNSNDLIVEGWLGFSSVLESPHTALEKLDLRDISMNDDTLTSLVHSLANNKKLKELHFWHSDWEPPQSVLCNTASILDTFN